MYLRGAFRVTNAKELSQTVHKICRIF